MFSEVVQTCSSYTYIQLHVSFLWIFGLQVKVLISKIMWSQLEHFTELTITSCHACKLSDFVSNTSFVASTPNKMASLFE